MKKLASKFLYIVSQAFAVLALLWLSSQAFTFASRSSSLGTIMVLIAVSFFVGFFANLNGKLIRPVAMVVALFLLSRIAAPYGDYADTDNFFMLSFVLGYIATPLANAKYKLLDKRLQGTKQTTEQ